MYISINILYELKDIYVYTYIFVYVYMNVYLHAAKRRKKIYDARANI